jgi:hypothetical protein
MVDRVRIQKIVKVADVEAADLNPPANTYCQPAPGDPDAYYVDGRWIFADGDQGNEKGNSWNWQVYLDRLDDMTDRIDNGLIHELGHQLGLIDGYRMFLDYVPTENNGIHVLQADGSEIPASEIPTWGGFNLFHFPGLMGGGDVRPHTADHFEDHAVGAMNSHAFKRRGYFGEYLFDTPNVVYLKVVDENGVPLANVPVQGYQKRAAWNQTTGDYRVLVDNDPECCETPTSNELGEVLMANHAVDGFTTMTGHTLKANPFGRIHHEGWNGGMFIRAMKSPTEPRYGWLMITDLNIAYWRGFRDQVVCTVILSPPRSQAGPNWPPERPTLACEPKL